MRDELVKECRTWIGTPVFPRGRKKGFAADCIFQEEVFRVVAGYDKRHVEYSLMPINRELERQLDADMVCVAVADGKPIKFDQLLPGRIALFVGRNPNEPQHVAMIADHQKTEGVKTIIHAYGTQRTGGQVVEHTLCSRESVRMNGEVRSILGLLWKLYDAPGVTHGR